MCVSCVQEYFSIPLSSLRSVLGSAHVSTVRLILQYYDRNKDTLQVSLHHQLHFGCFFLADWNSSLSPLWQLSDAYLSVMASVLFQKHLSTDDSLFPDVAPLLVAAAPADIQALPSLQNSSQVYVTVVGVYIEQHLLGQIIWFYLTFR